MLLNSDIFHFIVYVLNNHFFYIEYCLCDRLGPGTLCWSAAMLESGQMSPRAAKYKETVRDKNNCVCPQLGWIWTTRYKEIKKSSCHFRRVGSKSGCFACPLHTHHLKWRADPLSHPSSLTCGCIPTFTPNKEPTQPFSGSKLTRNLSLVLVPLLLQQESQ